MKIWIFSDLHLEFGWLGLEFEVPEADLCIVAGDVYNGGPSRSIEFLAEHVKDMPVVLVAGNHEFYGDFVFDGLVSAAREAQKHSNIHFLENDFVDLGEIAIAGATLWSDFQLTGQQDVAMRFCEQMMADYCSINWSKRPFRPLRAMHTLRQHRSSVLFLERFLDENRGKRTVVVTHHAPSERSIRSRQLWDLASAAFASDLQTLIEECGPDYWIHGHIHDRLDYVIGGTRVLCNARGYYGDPSFETFELGYVIEV